MEKELALFIVRSNPALGLPIFMATVRRHFIDIEQSLGHGGLISGKIVANDLTSDLLIVSP